MGIHIMNCLTSWEKREKELKPEQKVAEENVERAIKAADSLSLDGITGSMNQIKSEMNKLFAALIDRLGNKRLKYEGVGIDFPSSQPGYRA